MTLQTGLVIIDLTSSGELVKVEIERAMEATPEGRVLAAIYDLPKDWNSSYPWESEVSSIVLKNPDLRSTDTEWQILATLAIRCCKLGGKSRKVTKELGVVLFIRKGLKAYTRRGSTTESVKNASGITTLHPAFTRDIANNVWHLPTSNPIVEIKVRLAALLTWSDESTLIFRKSRKTTASHHPMNLTNSLIGVPTKIPYEW